MATRVDTLGPGRLAFTKEGAQATDFAGQCTKVSYKPEYKTEDPTPTLDGGEYLPPGELTGSIEGEMLQDFGETSLAKWCFDNMGETVEFTFTPNTNRAMTIKGKCQVAPVEIGGDVSKTNSTSFSFATVGKPTLTTTTPQPEGA